jgi:PAS domain S-box-containing protein
MGRIWFFRDITQQKQAERELKESRETLSLILNSTAEAVYGIDLNGCCTFCNQASLVLLGYDSEQELLGNNMHNLIHHTCSDGTYFPVHSCRIFKSFKAGEGTHADDELLWRRDGSSFPAEYWSYPQYRNGEIVGAVVTFFNISERKKAEAADFAHQQQLLAINQTLEQRVREEVKKNREKEQILLQQDKLASIGQLAAGVAHEINNPMGYISSNLRALTEYFDQLVQFDQLWHEKIVSELTLPTREEIAHSRSSLEIDQVLDDGIDLVRESLQGAERVTKIVKDLKSFSRVDALRENESIDLTSCMESALNVCFNELKYRAEVRREYRPVPEVVCNSGHLNQVFLNLLVNAGQAITPPGEIVLSCWHDDAFVYASVRDNGCGITEEVKKRIFDPFFTTKDVGKGTGLGLSISSEIIRQHGGELLVESEFGRGTTFIVKLPKTNDDLTQGREP